MRQNDFALNLPNVLTLIRILMTPLFVVLLINTHYVLALAIFALAGITDGLDGFMARIANQKTALGAFLDPVADKLLLISAYVVLGIQQVLPPWLSLVVISRDVLIVVGILVLTLLQVSFAIQPSMISKCTTVAQLATVFLALLTIQAPGIRHALLPLYALSAVLTIASGLHYIYVGIRILQNPAGSWRGDA
jgi:cardiolipin synthase